MGRVGPIVVVLIAIVVVWYAAAIGMNAQWQNDVYRRADLSEVPVAACFEKIELKGERTLVITYSKDKVNAGEVLAPLQAAGLVIVDVSTQEADLEDVFLNLTRTPVAAS